MESNPQVYTRKRRQTNVMILKRSSLGLQVAASTLYDHLTKQFNNAGLSQLRTSLFICRTVGSLMTCYVDDLLDFSKHMFNFD